jgi:hypothetical protein
MIEKFLIFWLYGWAPWIPFAAVLGVLSGADVVYQMVKSKDPAWVFGPKVRLSRKTSVGFLVFLAGYLAWPANLCCHLAPHIGKVMPPLLKILTRPCLPH